MKLVSFFFLFLLSSACSPVSRKKRNYRIQKSLNEKRIQVMCPRPVLSSLNVRLKKPSWTRGKLERESDKKRRQKKEKSGIKRAKRARRGSGRRAWRKADT